MTVAIHTSPPRPFPAAGVETNPLGFPAVALDRVCGVVQEPTAADSTVRALLAAGFGPGDIHLYAGPDGVARLDPAGRRHGPWARVLRTLQRLTPEGEHLRRYAGDLEAGRVLVSVAAKDPARARSAVKTLLASEAHEVHHYGRYTVEDFSAGRR